MKQNAHQKRPSDLYSLQEKWLFACADFDSAKGAGNKKRKSALGRMQRILRTMEASRPREVPPYRAEYERRLERVAGVRLPKLHAPKPKKKATKKR